MNVRIRTERHGKVALTMGAVVLTMPADEARALARAILHHADEADPVRRDRAFGEVLTPDVPAPTGDTFPRIGPTSLEVLRERVFNRGPDETIEAVVRKALTHGSAAIDVPAGLAAANQSRLDRLNHDLARARLSGAAFELLRVYGEAEECGYELRVGEEWFSPIGKPPTNRAPAAGI